MHGICLRQRDIVEAWNVASSQLMEFVVVKCWLVIQQRCKYVILAPLHLIRTAMSIIIDNENDAINHVQITCVVQCSADVVLVDRSCIIKIIST